jgi:hypothetical protein
MNEELYKKLTGLRLDTYAVDQGLMLNCLVGYLTGEIVWQDKNGKVSANDIVNAIERIHNQCKLVNN